MQINRILFLLPFDYENLLKLNLKKNANMQLFVYMPVNKKKN